MPKTCAVGGCTRNTDKNPDLKLCEFPKNESIQKQWVKFVETTRLNFKLTKWSLICKAHFTEDCQNIQSKLMSEFGLKSYFTLRKDAVPTIKAPNLPLNSRPRKGTKRPIEACEHDDDDEKREERRNSNEANGHQTEEDAPPCSPGTINGQQPEVAQGEQFWKEYHQIKAEAFLYRKACKTCKLLSLSNVKDDDRAFERYTGLPNYAVFEVLHDYMKPNSKWSGERTARDRLSNSTKRTLTSQEEFFMFLVTIKTGNLASDMALRFGITKPTFSVIFASWAVFVSNMLDDFGKTVMKPHASKFEELETIIVIDCTALLKRKTSAQPNENCLQKLNLLCVGISQDGVVTSVLGNLRGSASAEVVSSTSKNSDQVENSHLKVDVDQDEAAGKVPGEKTPAEKTPAEETPAEETLAMFKDPEQLNTEKPLRAKMSHHVNITLNRIRQFRYLKQEVEPSNVDLYEQVFKACAYLTNFQLAS